MDTDKLLAQKAQLASLCRSLQQENAALRDQLTKGPNLRASLDAVSSKYEALVADLKGKYETAGNDLETLKDRFRAFLTETEAREAHSAASAKAKDLEIALGIARLKEQSQLRDQAMKQAELLTAELSLRAQTETELKRQLDLYVDKFKQVEGTLTKSNDLFVSFRKEMESVRV